MTGWSINHALLSDGDPAALRANGMPVEEAWRREKAYRERDVEVSQRRLEEAETRLGSFMRAYERRLSPRHPEENTP